jgi:hypothetical protein
MPTGVQAFKGEDASDLLASVMKIDPDFGPLPSNVSKTLRELFRRCLSKSRKERWHAIGDLRVEIESITANPQDIPVGQGSKGILRVSANGGKPEQVVSVKSRERADGLEVLPGGDAIVYTLSTGPVDWGKAQIVVQTLKSGERKTLIQGRSDARFVPTGHIIYAISGSLFAVPFDTPPDCKGRLGPDLPSNERIS